MNSKSTSLVLLQTFIFPSVSYYCLIIELLYGFWPLFAKYMNHLHKEIVRIIIHCTILWLTEKYTIVLRRGSICIFNVKAVLVIIIISWVMEMITTHNILIALNATEAANLVFSNSIVYFIENNIPNTVHNGNNNNIDYPVSIILAFRLRILETLANNNNYSCLPCRILTRGPLWIRARTRWVLLLLWSLLLFYTLISYHCPYTVPKGVMYVYVFVIVLIPLTLFPIQQCYPFSSSLRFLTYYTQQT